MLENLPKTLVGITRYFANPQTCIDFVALLRWQDGEPVCHHCGNVGAYYLASRKIYKCKSKSCRKQFSVKQGTIFEESGVSLDKWLIAIWMIANCKNGISSYELGKNIGVEQRSAWFMLQRIRIAMEQGSFGKLSGTVEADETFIGGDAKWKHRSRRDADQKRGGRLGLKVSVLGMLERKGKVRAKVVASRTTHDLIPPIHEHVEFGSELFTDEHLPYMTHLPKYYIHDAVNHAREYVRGNVHTNSIENFWSLLKRSIKGTYISIQAEHLQKYIEEQCFRYNTREMTDRERFVELVKSVSGKRLTWDTLTGY